MWHVGPGTTGPRDEQAIIMSGVAIDQKLIARVSRESNAVPGRGAGRQGGVWCCVCCGAKQCYLTKPQS